MSYTRNNARGETNSPLRKVSLRDGQLVRVAREGYKKDGKVPEWLREAMARRMGGVIGKFYVPQQLRVNAVGQVVSGEDGIGCTREPGSVTGLSKFNVQPGERTSVRTD